MAQFSSRIWREFPQRYRLEAAKSKKSGKTWFPPRQVEPETGATEFEKTVLPETGKLLTYTVIRVPASQFSDEAPYGLGIAELTDGTRVMAQITDCDVEKIKIGMEVRIEFRKVQTEDTHGVLSYGYKFVPKWY